MKFRPRTLLLALALTAAAPVYAHEGHDHEAPPPPAVYEPRFEAHAGDVEVVGIVERDGLWLYASRYGSNAPWPGLKLELEQDDGKSVVAKDEGGGTYSLPEGTFGQPGTYAVVLSVSGEDIDELLTGELTVAKATGDARAGLAGVSPWAWGAGALLLAGGLAIFSRRRR